MLIFLDMMTNSINKLHKYVSKNWRINFFLTVIPSLYFTTVKIIGKQLGLVNNQGDLTRIGNWLFWISIIFSIGYGILKSVSESNLYYRTEEMQKILEDIVSSTGSVCSNNFQNLVKYIEKNSNKDKIGNIIYNVIRPDSRIKDLINELGICLSKMTDIKRQNIEISIFQKFDFNEKWECNYFKNTSNCKINDIIDNPRTTARQIIDDMTDIVFEDKKTAIEKNMYIPSNRDKITNNEGSIICKDISLKTQNNKYLIAVLNISTYGENFCSKDDEYRKNKIIDMIINPFVLRIKTELCYEYIKKMYEKKSHYNKKNDNEVINFKPADANNLQDVAIGNAINN